MAYQKNDVINKDEYNSFVGEPGAGTNKATVAFASDLAATEKAAALYGVGYGTRGYGQSTSVLENKSTGDSIGSSEWTALRNAINACATHQGTSTTLVPPTTVLEVGDTVVAHEQDAPSSNSYDFQDMLALIDTNRHNKTGWSPSTSVVITETRTTGWSSTIDCEIDVTWTSVDEARFFFNTGGEIRINMDQTTVSNSQDTDWDNIFNTVLGTITIDYTETTISGTGTGVDSVATLGYYDLTDAYQTLVDGTDIGTGAYSANDVTIEAKRTSTDTTNGGNGNGVRLRITLDDDHTPTGAGPDTVTGATEVEVSIAKATDLPDALETPSGAIFGGNTLD